MSNRDDRQEAALQRMAAHVLREGLAGASLRPLAAAAGTSDRMLLYYYADKDALLTAILGHVAMALGGELNALLPEGAAQAPDALVAALWAAIKAPALAPYMQLWLEIAAAAMRGQQPHLHVAGAIAGGFLDWIGSRLNVPEAARADAAAAVLARIEGLVVLDAVGRRDLADRLAGG